jgi:hydroxypyruvate isomerase
VLRRQFVGALAGAALAARSLPARFPPDELPRASGEVPFPLSVMLWTVYKDLPFAQRLEKVHEAGYGAVELVGEYKNWAKEDFAAARKKKQELGIEFDATAGVWHTLADENDREPFLKSLRAFLPTMKELECSKLILQSGNKVPGASREQMRANCIETLKRGGEIAAKNDIELLVENIDPEENPKYFLTSSAEGFEITRAVGNPHVKFLYDFFHEQIAEGNLIAKLEKNMDYLGLVHIADVPGRHKPGSGEINYGNIYRRLAQLGYSRYVAMEFIPEGDAVKELREARQQVADSVRSASSGLMGDQESRREHATA